jgi:chromosome condensin MukBEF ATPase and DNA-binding subunit MukB
LNRPFEVVRQKEAEASAKFQGVVNELQAKAEAAQSRINELQAQKSDQNQRFILSPEVQAELTKLEKESVETDKKLRRVKKDLAKEVDSLKTRITGWNVFAMPLLVTAGGILLALYKRKLTAAK